MQTLPVTAQTELKPGTYILTLRLEDDLLERLFANNYWFNQAAELLLARTQQRVAFEGAGVAWLPLAGSNLEKRFYQIKFTVLPTESQSEGLQLVSNSNPVVITVGILLTVLTIAIGANIFIGQVHSLVAELSPGAVDDIAEGFNNASRTFYLVTLAGIGFLAYRAFWVGLK